MSLRPQQLSPIAPGYRLDRYEFLCPIAEGGMASVWLARVQGKHGFEKLFAIKTILPEFASDFKFQQMFLDEARISSQIEHPNVAQILDVGDEQGILYLVMEWVDGDSLSKLLRAVERKGQTIPYGVSLRVLADACGGLHAAHELQSKDGSTLGVVHRDVSPQNILVSAKGASKVIDFGIAKARDRIAGDTNTGALKGKVQYMAPEQALGEAVDRRADVWAVGAVLYHLASGHPPYDGQNQLATLYLLTSKRPPLPLPSAVPAPIAQVIRKALSHDVSTRYATAAELQSALEQAMVASDLATTTADVAAFTAEYLSERVHTRKEAIALALSAAVERARVQDLLKPTSDDPLSSGRIDGRGVTLVRALPSSSGTTQPNALAAGLPSSSQARLDQPLSEKSSPTLGADGTMTGEVPLTSTGRIRLLFTGLAAVLTLLLLFSLALHRWLAESPRDNAGAAPPPSGATLATARPTETPAAPDAPRASAALTGSAPFDPTDAPSDLAPAAPSAAASSPAPVAVSASAPHSPGAAPRRARLDATAATTSVPPTPSTVTSTKPSCDPPYEFNAAGNRVFKKECL